MWLVRCFTVVCVDLLLVGVIFVALVLCMWVCCVCWFVCVLSWWVFVVFFVGLLCFAISLCLWLLDYVIAGLW